MLDKMKEMEREFLSLFPEAEKLCCVSNRAGVFGQLQGEFEFSYTSHGVRIFKNEIAVSRKNSTVDLIPINIPERLLSNKIRSLCKDNKNNYVRLVGEFRSRDEPIEDKPCHLAIYLWVKGIFPCEELTNNNMIFLRGRINKIPFLTKTPLGLDLTELSILVNRRYPNSLDYIFCFALCELALYTSELAEQTEIELWGKIQSRDYYKKISDNKT